MKILKDRRGIMKTQKLAILTGFVLLFVFTATAMAETVIEVQYTYAQLFDETQKIISEEFYKAHPDIRIKFRTAYDHYEDAIQKVLKESIVKRTPDVSFQGLNRLRLLVEKGIAQSLQPFIDQEKDFAKEGYHKAMLDIATFNGKIYALPFAVSLPIGIYNIDLVKKAGGDPHNLPKTWDDVTALAKKIDALGNDIHGMHFAWDITGNWLWQALNHSHCGSMLNPDEKDVAFGGPVGQWAIKTFASFTAEGKMPNISYREAMQTFGVGKIGVLFTSSAVLTRVTEWSGGKFELKTGCFPDMKDCGHLPAGGNGAVLLTKDPKKQQAAWNFIKFANIASCAAVLYETTC
jgi:multiple sugar transport system substrate-binding protein